MAEVTIKDETNDQPAAETPSAQLIRQAIQEGEVTDSNGRRIKLRKPGVLAQYRLIEALGDVSSNQAYMQMVNPLIYVGSIDGDDVLLPRSKAEVEALIQRLDDPGMDAVLGWYMEKVLGPTLQALSDAEQKARLKN